MQNCEVSQACGRGCGRLCSCDGSCVRTALIALVPRFSRNLLKRFLIINHRYIIASQQTHTCCRACLVPEAYIGLAQLGERSEVSRFQDVPRKRSMPSSCHSGSVILISVKLVTAAKFWYSFPNGVSVPFGKMRPASPFLKHH